jgi:hypothetical protein
MRGESGRTPLGGQMGQNPLGFLAPGHKAKLGVGTEQSGWLFRGIVLSVLY